MNKLNSDAFRGPETQQHGSDDEIDLSKIFAVIRRNLLILVFGGLVGLLLAVGQLATTTRLYTASVDINIGRSAEVDTFQDFSGMAGAASAEIQIETELLVLRSEKIAERVVRTLRLHENSQFSASQQSALNQITSFVRRSVARGVAVVRDYFSDDLPSLEAIERERVDAESRAIERAAGRLRSNMSATSLRGSRVLQVRYTSPNAALSAQVANAIAVAYIEDQLEATDAASQQAIDWLRQRRDQLREQLEQVVSIAEQFREENNLRGVDIDRLGAAELDRLTTNLVAARADVVDLEARERRLTEIVKSEDTSAVVRETAGQNITAGLRSRYLEALRAYNSLASTLGDDHAQTQHRLRDLEELQALMFEEVRRSAELVRDDLRAARERVESLEAAQSRVGQDMGTDFAVISELRDLERNIDTVRNLYTNFQQRHQEATQRQEIPVSNARILNQAHPPGSPSSPNAQRMLALGGLMGFLLAAGFVAFREWRDDRIRSEEDVRQELGLEYIGGLTLIKGKSHRLSATRTADATNDGTVSLPEIMSFAANKPLSNFSETLRTGKMSLTLRHGQEARAPKVGFVSAFPAEGKTTTAANFANLLAKQGAKVVLIDGDMRNPGLTQATGKTFERGLVDVLLGECSWTEVLQTVEDSGLDIIPNSKLRPTHTSELLGGNAMQNLLAELDQKYDYVALDLPSISPVVDARVILEKLDGVFFVLKWGGASRDMLKRVLRMDPRMRDKCYGAFLNMFDPKKAAAYGYYQGYGYYRYRSYYNRYYTER
jgi:succinoglycan biosynthesis transport protein ExoP